MLFRILSVLTIGMMLIDGRISFEKICLMTMKTEGERVIPFTNPVVRLVLYACVQ